MLWIGKIQNNGRTTISYIIEILTLGFIMIQKGFFKFSTVHMAVCLLALDLIFSGQWEDSIYTSVSLTFDNSSLRIYCFIVERMLVLSSSEILKVGEIPN